MPLHHHTGMKYKLFTFGFILLSVCSWSQQTAISKVYAYAQETSGGMRPQTTIHEDGKEQMLSKAAKRNYIIYAEQLKSTQISFVTLWIDGKAYNLKADIVVTPVEMMTGEGNKAEKIILAPATNNKTWSISPGALIAKPSKPSSTLQKLIDKNELVIVYRWKGKLYYSPIRKIKKLDPAVAV